MSAPIEVLAIPPYTRSGSVKAFVDLQLGGIAIKGCKIVPQEGQWLAMPSIKSERAWNNVVEITAKLRERITNVELAAWQRHEAPIRRPVRGTATRERTGSNDSPWGDSDAAVRGLTEGPGWERDR